jgi:hypothetical protein
LLLATWTISLMAPIYRPPRRFPRRQNAMHQHVPLSRPESPMDDRRLSPAEVEEPPEAPQCPRQEPGPANNIEVEEVVQHPMDEEVIQEQESTAERQPILLGMSTSMSQLHNAGEPTQEAFPLAPVEPQEAPVQNRAGSDRTSSCSPKEQMSTDGRDGQSEEGVAGQGVVANAAGKQPVDHGASPSTFVSSLHVSSVEQRDGRPGRAAYSYYKV